jgi:hypothetical protein
MTNSVRRTRGNVLYDRQWLVTIAPSLGSVSALNYGNTTTDATPLRITFDIKKDCKPEANPAHIVIYNMSEQNRRTVENGWSLQIQAGYPGQVGVLWNGQVGKGVASRNPDLSVKEKASTKKDGPDISFAIESGDGLGPLSFARINSNYRDGTPYQVVFNDIMQILTTQTPVTSFGVSLGSIPTPFPLGSVKRNLTLHCSCSEALTKLFKPAGYEWFVNNNALNVVAKTDHTRDGIPFLSSTTGLTGIPSKEDNGVVSLSCLLNPQLSPGRLLELKSEDSSFDGYYKVRKVQHKGDTHGDAWDTEVECIQYNDDPSLPISTPPIT